MSESRLIKELVMAISSSKVKECMLIDMLGKSIQEKF